MTFPSNVISLAVSAGSNFLSTMFGGSIAHSTGINLMLTNLIATQKRVGTGSQTAPARGQALIGTGTADGDGNQGSIWDRYERKNLIANGTGRTKQRTTMPTTDNSYAIDRMRLLMENANGFTITQETTTLPTAPAATTGFRFTVGAGNNGKGGGFWPVIADDMAEVAGGVLSLQCQLYISNVRLANLRMGIAQFTSTADAISGDPVSAWGADGTNPTLAANWSFADTPVSLALTATTYTQKFSQNVSISSSAKNVAVLIWNDARTTTAADFFIVTDIELERGAVSTAVERLPVPLERDLCFDWLQVLDTNSTSARIGNGVCTATTTFEAVLPLPHAMRVVPSGTYPAAAKFQVYDGQNVTVCSAALTTNSPTKKVFSVGGTVASGLTQARPAELLGVDSASFIILSAEP